MIGWVKIRGVGMDQITQDQKTLLEIGGGASVVLILALAAVSYWASKRRRAREQALQAREMAVMEEEVNSTTEGKISFALLALSVLGSITIFAAAKTVFQEIEAGVMLIAGSILFGLGVALGRTRTYRIYRSEYREPH